MAGQAGEPGSSRVFRCNICDTYSTNEQNFITHLESSQHLEQLLLTDLLSQRSYRKLCSLDKLQSQVCNICGTEFGDFTDFITHMKKKHSARKVELYLHSLHGSSASSGSVCSDRSENAGRRESLQNLSNADLVYCDTCEMSINSRNFNFHTLSKGHEANLNRISMMQSLANSKLKSTHESTSQCPQEESVPRSAVPSLSDFTFPTNIYNITSRSVNSDEVSMQMNNNCISDDLEALHSKYYCQICLVDCKTADKLDIHQSESDHLKREKMLVESSKSGAANTATTVDPDKNVQFTCTVCKTKWMDNNNKISHESSARHKNALDVYSRSFASINATKGSVRCTLCTLDCSSQVCFIQHEKGKKHKAFLDEVCWAKKSFGSNPGSVSSASKHINSFSSENSFNSELKGSSSGSSKVADFSGQPVETVLVTSKSSSANTEKAITSKVTTEDSQVCSFQATNEPLSNVCSKCGKAFPVQASFGNTTKVDLSEPWLCQSCYFDFKDIPDQDEFGDIQCYICGIFLPMDYSSVLKHCRTQAHIHKLLQKDPSVSRSFKTNKNGGLTTSSLEKCNAGSYFGCPACNDRLDLSSLGYHLNVHGTSKTAMPCDLRCLVCESSINLKLVSVFQHCCSSLHVEKLVKKFPSVAEFVKLNPNTGVLTHSSLESCNNEKIFECGKCQFVTLNLKGLLKRIGGKRVARKQVKLTSSQCVLDYATEVSTSSLKESKRNKKEDARVVKGTPSSIEQSTSNIEELVAYCRQQLPGIVNKTNLQRISTKVSKEPDLFTSNNANAQYQFSAPERRISEVGGYSSVQLLKTNEALVVSNYNASASNTSEKASKDDLESSSSLSDFAYYQENYGSPFICCRICEELMDMEIHSVMEHCKSRSHTNVLLHEFPDVEDLVKINPDTGLLTNSSANKCHAESVFGNELSFKCELCFTPIASLQEVKAHIQSHQLSFTLDNSILSSRYGANVQEEVEIVSSEDDSIEEVSSRPLVSEFSSITDNRNYKTSVLTKNTLTSATLDGSASDLSGTVPKSFANIQGFSEQQGFGLLELPKFTCGKCGVIFDGNRSSFLEHQETHEDLDIWDSPCGSDPELKSTSFLCSICSSVIKGSGPALNHYDAHRMHIIQELFHISALTIKCLNCNKLLPFLECEIHAHNKGCDQNLNENDSVLPRFGCCFCKISFTGLTDISIYVTCTLSQHLQKLKLLPRELKDKEQNTDWNTAKERIFVDDKFDLHALCYHTEVERNERIKSSKVYYCKVCQCRCFSEHDKYCHEEGRKHKAAVETHIEELQSSKYKDLPAERRRLFCVLCTYQYTNAESFMDHKHGEMHAKNLAKVCWKEESRDSFNDLSKGSTDLPKNSLSRVPGNLPSVVPGNELKVVPGTSTGLPKSSDSRTSRIMTMDSARGSLYDALSNAAVLQALKPKKGDEKKKTKPGATSEQKTMSTKTNKTSTSKSNIPNVKTISNSNSIFLCVCGTAVIIGNLKAHISDKTHKKKLCQTFFGSDNSCVKCGVIIGSSPNRVKLSHLSSVHYIA